MDCFVALLLAMTASPARQSPPSAKTRGKSYDLAVETVEAVMAAGFAGVALLDATAQPGDARAPARPFDEGVDAGRQGRAAGIGLT